MEVRIHTNRIGDRSVGEVMSALLRYGYVVLLPFGEFRYDLVAERDGVFNRIQVKTGRYRKGVVTWDCFTVNGSTKVHVRYQAHEIDAFGVYAPDLDRVYLVPFAECGRAGSLRIDPAKNNQTRGVRLAADYELPRIAQMDRAQDSES